MSVQTYLSETSFQALTGWQESDHVAALHTFLRSAAVLLEDQPAAARTVEHAQALARSQPGDREVSAFFEREFRVFSVNDPAGTGLLTGYYEPVLSGARTPSDKFKFPLLRRPADLVTLIDDARRGSAKGALTHARRTAAGLEPYFTRADIEQGAVAGQGLEFAYLADPVDAFFLHVQGSGIVDLIDGGRIRVGYDGKNGHPYTSVGRTLIDQGSISAADMSLATLRDWLSEDVNRGRAAMWRNSSFVFFKERPFEQAGGPHGVRDIVLTEGVSLAIDASLHQIGLPVFVMAPTLTHADNASGFHRLMIAQDVGSAITGLQRGDVFFGTGEIAGQHAGVTKHPVSFHILLPHAMVVA